MEGGNCGSVADRATHQGTAAGSKRWATIRRRTHIEHTGIGAAAIILSKHARRRMMRPTIIVVGLLVAIIGCTASCSHPSLGPHRSSSTLTFTGLAGEPDSLNPLVSTMSDLY